MKKNLLIASLLALLVFGNANAQIVNGGFENWSNNTSYFDGFSGFLPLDTFQFSDPDSWTTTNAFSGAASLGGNFLVTQSSDAYTGSSALRIETDTLKTIDSIPFLGTRQLTVPGLVLNGNFSLTLSENFLLGGTISPATVPGAGQPFTQRLGSINGYFKYLPVFNDSANAMDSFIVWATLRKGAEVIADAVFASSDTALTYTPFSAPFVYQSCETPDTLVILIASSIPNFGSVLTGETRLVRGSVLLIDDLTYDADSSIAVFPPIANDDTDTTDKNTAKTINVTANDEDCDNAVSSLTVAVATPPTNGTAVVSAGAILYTPNNNFTGTDNFTYSLSDGVSTSTASVTVEVLDVTGISKANEIAVSVYPVPASNVVNIRFENKGETTLRVYDVTGKLVLVSLLNKNENAISTSELSNGIYNFQLSDEKNNVIARSKFTVNK